MTLRFPSLATVLTSFVLAVAVLVSGASLGAQQSSPSSAMVPVNVTQDPAFAARANAIIDHSRKLIGTFFEQTSNVVCTENISQMVLGKNNKPVYKEESVFEYQLQSNTRTGSLRLTETRDPVKVAFRDPNRTLLITNGFASLLLILHEKYESSYVFVPVSEETADGRTILKVHFKPVPGAASPAAIQLRGRNYPLPVKGEIWLDEDSAAVVELITSLDSSLEDVGLRELRSEISYSIVEFHSPEEAYWMPASAVIDLETPKQHWRNVHRFTGYRRFRATIQVDMGEKQP
jgi:hypothetical protein